MKSVVAASALAFFVVLSGCSTQSQSNGWTEQAGDINTAIQIQIAVRSQPYEPGDNINDGEFYVVSSNVLPLKSTGGPGHIVSSHDGVIMELRWDDVRLLQTRKNQHAQSEFRISFENFDFDIRNKLVRPDGVGHHLGSRVKSRTLSSTFDLLFSPVTFTSGADGRQSALVVRARLNSESEPAEPVSLAIDVSG